MTVKIVAIAKQDNPCFIDRSTVRSRPELDMKKSCPGNNSVSSLLYIQTCQAVFASPAKKESDMTGTEAKISGLVICLLLAAALGENAAGQASVTTSELLQKGIYLQETVGDLDGAIKVYRQIAQMASESRANAAQAEYRLAVCLQKKGQQEEASRAFSKLIEKYPEQTEIVAKARQFDSSRLQLLPAPWEDGEVLEYSAKMGTMPNMRADLVKMQYSIHSSTTHAGNWSVDYRIYNADIQWISQVEADRETMKPVSSLQNLPMMQSQTDYLHGTAKVVMKGKEPRVVSFNGPAFDVNELVAIIRRLALAPGYKTAFSAFSAMAGAATRHEISVTGTEEIQTPAGKFQCYRVELANGNQTYWISTGSSHYPVKMEGGPVTSELLAIRRAGSEPTAYHNEKLGLSLTVPAGWMADEFSDPKSESGVQLIVPGSSALVKLSLRSAPSPACAPAAEPEPASQVRLRSQAEERMKAEAPLTGNLAVRDDSWHTSEVSGYQAIRWIADGKDQFFSGEPVATYSLLIPTLPRGSVVEFFAKAEPKEFDALRPQFDAIIDSLSLNLK
jgi:hypothetical protein